uniref:Uncharacterized protein n=1 Tax=Rhizobium meliloti TaxID=382 RepID=Q3L5D1_RHIML|nr:hypothetical protein [Sinorhizobium meliloti]
MRCAAAAYAGRAGAAGKRDQFEATASVRYIGVSRITVPQGPDSGSAGLTCHFRSH